MNYQRIYDALITYRKENVIVSGYIEVHHIKMSSLGGSDDESNLVKLTAREHYIAHLLLARFNRCSQTAYALWMMQLRSTRKSSRMYAWAREEFSKYISINNSVTSKGERNSQHGTRWICNLELKENQKISKTDELPQGWILGRNKWARDRTCVKCSSIYITSDTSRCCPTCRYAHRYRPLSEERKSNISKSLQLFHAQ